MNNLNDTGKKLLFISEQICEISEDLYNLTMKNLEKSDKYDYAIGFFENYISQETVLLDDSSKEELISLLSNFFEFSSQDIAINRCYETIRYYFLNKYPDDKAIIEKIEGIEVTEIVFFGEDDDDDEFDEEEYDNEYDEEEYGEVNDNEYPLIELEYEDERDVSSCVNYTILRTKINVIKKIQQHIINTMADNKVDSKYKKELLKQLKGFKCDFFFQNRDTEQLGIKCHFDINKLPSFPKLEENVSSIYYNECLDILDGLYLMPNEERNTYTILEMLFYMLCFDEYIKELSHEQIDKLIQICHKIENNTSKSFFGNIGLQKLVRKKKN